jgi:hypothetical protein
MSDASALIPLVGAYLYDHPEGVEGVEDIAPTILTSRCRRRRAGTACTTGHISRSTILPSCPRGWHGCIQQFIATEHGMYGHYTSSQSLKF